MKLVEFSEVVVDHFFLASIEMSLSRNTLLFARPPVLTLMKGGLEGNGSHNRQGWAFGT